MKWLPCTANRRSTWGGSIAAGNFILTCAPANAFSRSGRYNPASSQSDNNGPSISFFLTALFAEFNHHGSANQTAGAVVEFFSEKTREKAIKGLTDQSNIP